MRKLSNRERMVVLVTGLVLALLLLDRAVLTPLLDQRELMLARRDVLVKQLDEAATLMKASRAANDTWAAIRAGGLKPTAEAAEGQFLNALRTWSQEAGVTLSSIKPERTTQAHELSELGFQAAGAGGMQSLSRLLYRLETTSLPVRVREVQISARSEGSDDLSFTLRLSTLFAGTRTDGSEAAAAPTEGRS